MRFRSWRFTAFIAMAVIASALVVASQTVRAQAPNGAKRLAFVIGNGAYTAIPPLQNALNDATATRSVLQEAGFEVVPATDATLSDLRGALDRFIERVREAGRGTTALVYYAGHAVQLDGTNYLLPVDVRPQRSADIPAQALSLSDILRRLDGTGAVSKIVVLDACRNNPFATAELSRGLALHLVDGAQDGIRSEAGLARIDSGSGTFVAFSTSPGATAADGAGANSPFTTAFLREIREPGLPVEQLFRRIRLSVHDATGGQQIPWDTSSLITDFAFFQSSAGAAGTAPPTAPATAQTPSLTLRPTATSLRAMAPAEAYRAAIAWDRRDLYRATLEAHPDDERALRLHRTLALRTEETAWAETVRAGDAESFRLFARLYPGSSHVAEALRLAPGAPSRNRVQTAAICPVCPAVAPRSRRADYTPRAGAPARIAPARSAPPQRQATPSAAPAQAGGVEPLPPALLPAKPRWTGFYVGGSVGGGDQRSPTVIQGVGPRDSVQTSIAAGNVASRLSPSGSNAVFTGQIGFNYQLGPMVLGAETDFSAMHTGGRKASTVNPFGVEVTTQAQTELFTLGTVRARAGIAFGDLLVFATGGYAYGHLGQRGAIAPVPTNNPTYAGSNPQMASGWALGGGLEYAVGPMLSVKLDYLHYDLGTQRLVLGETAGFFTDEYATMRAKTRGDMVRMGLNIGF
ncbi:MAG TPA: caspase family protein [Bosea sp. (in: a-proteobacteria)]|uniref:caspase family protein n=1 Tax=Bosea sp. (in: a-proteobacteria) TaxID=1871050 RepID=UPI002DDCC61E|nr:caspase family protein [Bosea sp. (in: a-proteobacteria)]HEV2556359.1 caspase family protein [Bosea sp. (in: a-proteobacteria)]